MGTTQPVIPPLSPAILQQATPDLFSARITLTFTVEFIMSGKVRSQGFTLIELLIILTLLAIIAAIAVPNFVDFIQRSRIQSQAEELKVFLTYARGEAVSRNTVLVVTQDDESHWVVQRNNGETMRQLTQNPDLVQIEASADEIRFRSNGTASTAEFTVCQDADEGKGFFLQVQASGAITLYRQGTQNIDGTALSSCSL